MDEALLLPYPHDHTPQVVPTHTRQMQAWMVLHGRHKTSQHTNQHAKPMATPAFLSATLRRAAEYILSLPSQALR